jgi:DNA-binding LytR/AlgR family response regulator
MKIAICDDNESSIELLSSIIRECKADGIEIVSFLNGKDLLKEINDIDVVFLDIDMPEMDGFEVGKQIRKVSSKCKIIMATATTHRFQESFKIEAIRYLMKPFVKKDVEEALNALPGDEVIVAFYKRNECKVLQREIVFIRAYNGYVEIYTQNIIYRKDVSLKKCMLLLSEENFFQVNRTIVVGLEYVIKEEEGKIILPRFTTTLSRSRKQKFREAYIVYNAK